MFIDIHTYIHIYIYVCAMHIHMYAVQGDVISAHVTSHICPADIPSRAPPQGGGFLLSKCINI